MLGEGILLLQIKNTGSKHITTTLKVTRFSDHLWQYYRRLRWIRWNLFVALFPEPVQKCSQNSKSVTSMASSFCTSLHLQATETPPTGYWQPF